MHNNIIIFTEKNKLKYLAVSGSESDYLFAYDLVINLNWILKDFFSSDEISDKNELKNIKLKYVEAHKRAQLYNDDVSELFNYYYSYLSKGKEDDDAFEWGNYLLRDFYKNDSGIPRPVNHTLKASLKNFLFMSNLNDFMLEVYYEPKFIEIKSKLNIGLDGDLVLVENVFDKLLVAKQNDISEIDKNHIHKFVRLSSYFKDKQENIHNYFKILQSWSKFDFVLNAENLQEQIFNYEHMLFHGVNMIVSLLDNDQVTFYEIYEVFDKENLFNSNWENEVSKKLSNIEDKMDDLIASIKEMDLNIFHVVGL
jgi:hypothetical protein